MRFPVASEAIGALAAAFLVAAAISFLATPVVRRFARRLGVVDRPEARRVNTKPIARGGGIAIAAGFLPVAVALLVLNGPLGWHFLEQPREIGASQLTALLAGAVLAVFFGALDDFFQLRARWQFLGQLVLAAVAISLGVIVTTINDPFAPHGTISVPSLAAAAVTVFWVVGMMNSINFIDGLDGLSSGIALIAALTLGGISITQEVGEPFVALFCFALAGALAGFLRWNFHPASIFAGTSGTMLVGYTLAVLSILGTAKVAVALLVLGVPIIDTFWIIVRRIASRRAPFAPDRGHIHHRLLDLGLSHRSTVLLIYAVCVGLAVLSFLLSGTGMFYAFLGLVLVFGLGLLLIARTGGGEETVDADLDRSSYEASGNGASNAAAAEPPAAPVSPGARLPDTPDGAVVRVAPRPSKADDGRGSQG